MVKRKAKKMVHEGELAAEVEVTLIENDEGWSPYLSLEDAEKLDAVREALQRGDVEVARREAYRVYKLVPISA
jgi:hypothetical protein